MRSGILSLAMLAACTGVVARANDPFLLTARTESGVPTSVSASGSSVVDLVDDLVNTRSDFVLVAGRPFAASLQYGKIEDAVLFQQNGSGTAATLTIPSTGFTRTFTGSDADDVYDQIREFLVKEGDSEYAAFLRTINERSLLGVTDGNPLAATALLSNGTFTRFGLERGALAPPAGISDGFGARYDVRAGIASTDEGDGYFVGTALSTLLRFNERVGLAFALPLGFRKVEDADIYHVGAEIALPLVLVAPDSGNVIWQLTPAFLAGASGSEDLAAGGTLLGGSLTSSLRLHLGSPRLIATVANQFSFFEGSPLNIGEYEFDTDLSQQVVKTGVRLAWFFSDGAFLDGSITHTAFLQDAAVDDYLSPGAGIGFYLNRRHTSGVRFAYQADLADEYTAHSGTVQLYLNY